ncbi:MAG TPA: translation initiation factor IF-2 [Ignavibacteriales bacterium]|nr:translation initiation factor IF-2 [Ignavibacteriales bacterium]HOL80921.1 translation initiation factor IF-2 [Ignavibacteriales bacterium]HOM64656.1 translation initiation factor IF-2 [Ignavibacteriales bacterium]HPD66813.1 translation initiation factor IF-2 [Ignavibacteriales bacterium]HPP32701.1 translation initiation factor IF-2 [Ignavibacteriales bacterium]
MEKTNKLRIVKFAGEYDIPTGSIIDFLKNKGYEIKGANSVITEDMLKDLRTHFKKDIEKAEAKLKKVSELKGFEPKTDKVDIKEDKHELIIDKKEESVLEVKTDVEEKPKVIAKEEPKVVREDKVAKITVEEKHEKAQETPQVVIPEVIKEEKVEVEQKVQHIEKKEIQEDKTQVKSESEVKAKEQVAEEDSNLISTSYKLTKDGIAITENEKAPEIDHGITQKYETETEKELKKNKLNVVGHVNLDKDNRYEGKHKNFKDKNKFDKFSKEGKDKKQSKPFNREGAKEQDKFTPRDGEKFDKKPEKKESELAKTISETVKYEPPLATEAPKKKANKDKFKKKGKKGVVDVEEGIEVKKKKNKKKKFTIDEREVEEAIRRTLSDMDDNAISERAAFKKKKKKEKQLQELQKEEQRRQEETIIKVTEYMTVSDLAERMNVSVGEVISKAMGLGMMVSINQRLELDLITLLADEFGYTVEEEEEFEVDELADREDAPEELQPRPPIVTVMGHVDHGKTTLLDYIRNTNVVAGESGGITQHIGAYRVELPNGKSITFLDTPGHEAFTAMRARGAKLTDIVILVVAADDSVMPQTIEAINHAQAAQVPIIVAINKIDKPGVDIDKIKRQLAEHNVLVEDWGGKYQCVEISAKKGLNIDTLLEKVILEAELLDLKANPNREARGVVVEAELDKGRGIVATILVQKGTLRTGDPFVVGIQHGRVRAMTDERGNKLEEAGPSTPVQVLGFEGMPQAGDNFVVVDSEKTARSIAIKRQQLKRELDRRTVQKFTLDEFSKQVQAGQVKNLPIIVKGDVDGSVEALADSFMKLSNDQVRVDVIHKAVGGITESDVLLATASKAIIIGFHVRPNLAARKLAENENIEIRLYNVIYDAINDVKAALEGLLSPVISEEVIGIVEVRDVFKVPKVGTVAGCYVLDGKIKRGSKVTVIRDGIEIFRGEISSLKRFKDDVREVDAGYECGLSINNFNDIKVGDIIEVYQLVETKQTLD